MELEELKDKWKMLSEEVANQKILTQNILEKSVKDKVKTVVSDAQYVGGFGMIFLLGVFILVISLPNIPHKMFLLCILILTLIWGLWDVFFETKNLKKVTDVTLSLCEREDCLMRYKRYIKRAYIFIAAIFIPLISIWLVLFQIEMGESLLWSISKLLLYFLPVFFGSRYGLKKMKKIEESFKEYKEFMEKEI